MKKEVDQNKRNFVIKAAYTAPVIITMAAIPSFASAGSGYNSPGNPGSGPGIGGGAPIDKNPTK